MEDKMDSLKGKIEEFKLFKYYLANNSISNKLLKRTVGYDAELKKLADNFKLYQKITIENIKNNQETFEKYINILIKCKQLSKELGLKNSLEISNLFTYLLWNGYYSRTKTNSFQVKGRHNVMGLFSLDLMLGIGVCLNHSSMLRDFLNRCGYPSSTIITDLDRNPVVHYKPNISRIIKNETSFKDLLYKFFLPITGTQGNHVFNLIDENGKLYIYDSTNLLILKLNNKNTASVIAGEGKYVLGPFNSYRFNYSDNNISALDRLNVTKDFTSPYNSIDFIIAWENCISKVNDNNNLIEDYYKDTLKDIHFIAHKLETGNVKGYKLR